MRHPPTVSDGIQCHLPTYGASRQQIFERQRRQRADDLFGASAASPDFDLRAGDRSHRHRVRRCVERGPNIGITGLRYTAGVVYLMLWGDDRLR